MLTNINISYIKLFEYDISINELFTILKIKYPKLPFFYSPIHFKSMVLKKYIDYKEGKVFVTDKGMKLLIDCDVNAGLKISDLALELRNLYPIGKKNSIYYWKGSPSEIERKLTVFFRKYGTTYTSEQIINATKKYVRSFTDENRDRAMMLLKYFIEKNGTSTLTSFLENNRDTENLKIIGNRTRDL